MNISSLQHRGTGIFLKPFSFSYLGLACGPNTACNICFAFYFAHTTRKQVPVRPQSENILWSTLIGKEIKHKEIPSFDQI